MVASRPLPPLFCGEGGGRARQSRAQGVAVVLLGGGRGGEEGVFSDMSYPSLGLNICHIHKSHQTLNLEGIVEMI